jgi:microcystin-dependent protein
MAGSISLSLSQQFDELGAPLNGGLLQFYAAGTTTPQSAYQDVALTIPHTNPIVLDAAGRVPAFYLADGQIKIRLSNSAGVVQVAADNLLVIGASSGTATPPSVDATTVLATGDIKVRYATGALSGFVRSNGRTIGSASSGASERANADCEDLFVHLWTEDANLSVSTGRGASAAADWAANKTIALPDYRGRALVALDDMGNSAAGRLTSTYFGTAATALGAAGGSESHTLTTAQLAAHSHGVTDPEHSHSSSATNFVDTLNGGSAYAAGAEGRAVNNTQTAATGITIQNTGGGGAHNNVQPSLLATVYLKL